MNARMAPRARLLIIGDDLSGTADCAATCVNFGLDSMVVLGASAGESAAAIDVLALDTDSRQRTGTEAAHLNRHAWRTYAGDRKLYKKIDSTLRGHVAAEIAALADAGMAIVAPAFPRAGRTTKEGRQFVFGVPVEASEVWRNEHIAGKADIVAMLAGAGLKAALIRLDAVREGSEALREKLIACLAGQFEAVVCDSETDADLDCIAAASAALQGVFWVGSAGLATPLIRMLDGAAPLRLVDGKKRHAMPVPAVASSQGIGILAIVGSMSSISHGQALILKERGADAIDMFQCDAPALLDPQSSKARALAARVSDVLQRGRSALVVLSQSERTGVSVGEGARLARTLASHLGPVARHAAGLIATGGETARAMLSNMGVDTLNMVDEIDTGVPLMVADHLGRVLPVVTKAGGFGQPDTLYRAWQKLRAMHQADAQAPHLSSREENMTYRPVIGITMGDAAGVGPEIIMKSLAQRSVYQGCRPLVIGDANRLVDAGRITGVALTVRAISNPAEARFTYGEIDCIDLGLIPADLPYGKLSALAGNAAYQYIARTVELTSAGELDAICTAPLNKEALHAGGHIFPGHTEILAHLTGIPEVSMMLVAPKLRVIHVTTHIGLIDAINRIEPGLVQRTIERAHETLVRSGIAAPRIGVCGINPHAGENGLFGYGEEEQKIIPAIKLLQERGWDVEGPLPADTLFYRAGRGDFDVVVAMYHDQGHGPVKVMGLEAGVNVTVGLPVIRTSVDHGTAFDIAGKGIADEGSMLEALKQAQDLATRHAALAA
ncbi:4-hydroxythreonine-4-phosphate dehydrogenase [Herbaspirillum sp. CF444]|uniref:4-hydroxythreonine-4-phosphate dehydrogenase PdxA n=1 Tax=Herbaspirillum sp. CF444 TaxID=1144319 RepID=UPI0002728476|nr:4-hydroxythreonine-4-phosphate dehydrogenase PdxA [Herbaspirillum sp. CF444]EJL81579.1 4-hydroxythreonine-4-phosphate dehydrogenase [Herbaspirillum sp. CF444]